MTRPPPLTDADADLTMFKDMPLEVVRFAKSDLVAFASAEGVLAALMLWGSAWHSRPAGSLTNDDRALARAAGYGRGAEQAWQGVRADALRGWIECSDGRLYHPVLAEKVGESWAKRLQHSHRVYASAIRVHNNRNPHDQRDGLSYDHWLEAGRPTGAKAAARKPKQEEMDLSADLLRATGDNVARNINDGNANDAAMFAEKTLEGKGREGKGRESIIQQQPLDSAKLIDDGVKPDPMDVTILADDLARRAGVPNTQPSSIMRNVEVVRTWLKDGIDLATIVKPEIDRFRLDKPEQRVASLLFFDQSVRAKVAATEAKARKGSRPHKPGITGAPVAPLKAEDDVDERVGMIRAKLNGNPAHHADAVALSIAEHGEDDGDPPILIVTARSSFAASRVDRDLLRRITHELFAPLAFDVEVRVQ